MIFLVDFYVNVVEILGYGGVIYCVIMWFEIFVVFSDGVFVVFVLIIIVILDVVFWEIFEVIDFGFVCYVVVLGLFVLDWWNV